ncbi:MAG: PorV/PorQ family protein [candidate division WOR-3 bacterium]
MKRKARLCFLFFLFWDLFGYGPGETGYNFLKLGIGARPVAMGSAFTGVADDAHSIFWNPGGVALFPKFDATLMMMNLFSHITYGALGVKFPLQKRLGCGIGMALLSAKDTRRDDLGEEIGEYYFNNFLFTTVLSFRPLTNLSLGFALKGIGARLDTFFSYSFALDGGGLYSPKKNLFLGAGLFNLGTPQKFSTEKSSLPTNLRLGLAYKIPISLHYLLFASDCLFALDQKPNFSFGGELKLNNLPQKSEELYLRAGYQTGYHLGSWKGISFGIGYARKIARNISFVIDATYFDYGYVGASERISLSLRFD